MVKLKNGIHLSVQSYCFRDFKDKAALLGKVKDVGLDAVEICGVHVNFGDKLDEQRYIDLANADSIRTVSSGINGFPKNEDEVEKQFEFAAAAGFKVLGADPEVDALPLIEHCCDKYGMQIAVHNHGRHHRYGSWDQLDALFSKASANVGLCLDTAWMIDSGHDVKHTIEKYCERLYGVHLKDMIYSDFKSGAMKEVPCGDGELDLQQIAPLILAAPNLKYVSIEYEEKPEDPTEDIRKCVANVQKYFC